jgi:hypothetical protein
MHGRGIEAPGQLVTQFDAFFAIRGSDADLDQFVGGERAVGLRDEPRRDAGVADAHDWFESMRPRFQAGTFAGG